MRPKFIPPTPEENAVINTAALSDPANPPLPDEELAQFRRIPGRPPLETPKVFTGIRLDADIVASFKSTSKGWQTKINAALRDWLKTHSPA